MINQKVKNVIILILLAILSLHLTADRVDDAIRAARGKDIHPDAPVVDILSETTINIQNDFSYTIHILSVKKILNYQGKKNFSDIRLGYNADFRKIEVGKCYSIAPDGTRIPVPINQIYDLDDRRAIANPALNTRDTFINFPQIEPGYYTVLEYTIVDSRRIPVNGQENFQVGHPVLKKVFSLDFPESHMLKTYFDPKKLTFKKDSRNKRHVYTWEINDAPMIKRERNMPYYLVSGSPLIYSFYKDWQDLAAQHLSKLTRVEIDDSIKKLAREITKGIKTDQEKLVAIYKYIYKNLNYHVSISMDLDFQPIPLKKLMEQKWGTQRDMTALFVALARSAGVGEVYPAFLLNPHLRTQPFLKDIPIHFFINRVLVYWKDTLIGPGNADSPFGFCGFDTFVIVGKKGYPMVSFHLRDVYTQFNKSSYTIEGKSVTASFRSRFSANVNQFFRTRFFNQPPVRQKIWFNQMIGERAAILVEGPNFLNFDKIDEDLRLEYKLKFRDHLVEQPPYCYMKISPTPIFLDVSASQRHGDFQIYTRQHIREEITVDVDHPGRFLNPFAQIRHTFPVGDSEAFFEFFSRMEGDRIVIEREFFLPEGIIKQTDYANFRRFILGIKDPLKHMVFLEREESNSR